MRWLQPLIFTTVVIVGGFFVVLVGCMVIALLKSVVGAFL